MQSSHPAGTDKKGTDGKSAARGGFHSAQHLGIPRLTKHCVVLLGHPDECCSPAELFELGSPYVGTGRPKSSQDIQNCVLHIPFVRHFHSLALRGPAGRGKRRWRMRVNPVCFPLTTRWNDPCCSFDFFDDFIDVDDMFGSFSLPPLTFSHPAPAPTKAPPFPHKGPLFSCRFVLLVVL